MIKKDQAPASAEELLVTGLAQIEALVKLLVGRGIITQQEFLQKTAEGRAMYQILLDAVPPDLRSPV